MRIYSMTATFGKLEHKTLTLEPGLNVIQAPNEWGKSTWCAFLLAMLYGVETKTKAARGKLPDKERYAPWSGQPMSGRVELSWQGRNITIERSTQGRIPMGRFRAYETDTGLEVPELDGDNCGKLLLGVERSVFQRAGFIRQADLPLTQDDALRQRLNALVTTGDESGDGARLEKGLRELKNRCRYNRYGLLPQARQEYEQLAQQLAESSDLHTRLEETTRGLEENLNRQASLENHAAALAFQRSQMDAQQVAAAQTQCRLAEERLQSLEAECAQLPQLAQIEEQLGLLGEQREAWEAFQQDQHSLPLPPSLPQVPECFLGLTPAQAEAQAEADAQSAQAVAFPWWLLGLAWLLGAGVLFWLQWMVGGILCAVGGGLCLIAFLAQWAGRRKRRRALVDRYGGQPPAQWKRMARDYARAMETYQSQERCYAQARQALASRRQALLERQEILCGEKSMEQCTRELEAHRRCRQNLLAAREELRRAVEEWEARKAMARPAPPPAREDERTETAAETQALLEQARQEEQLLRSRLGQYRGRLEALSGRGSLESRREALEGRIRELERYDAALTLAQQTLTQATQELQRRFAPRISREAQAFLARLTLGRYDRLRLTDQLAVQAGAREENLLRDAQWRSDGTADQVYLALRLAVAQALTPEAPLILDDALVRFDDRRLEAAMEVLAELAQTRQVLLFTCQQREGRYQPVI